MLSLKNVLIINGTTSGATGAGLVVLANFVAGIFGVTQVVPFWGVGLFLVAFALLVISEGLRDTPNPKRVQLIIALDIAWVLMSLLVVIFQMFDLSMLGYILISGVGLWVALMAWLQLQGLSAAKAR